MGQLYHCGYPGRAPEDLRRIAELLDATVVDIRYSALMAAEPCWRGALRSGKSWAIDTSDASHSPTATAAEPTAAFP